MFLMNPGSRCYIGARGHSNRLNPENTYARGLGWSYWVTEAEKINLFSSDAVSFQRCLCVVERKYFVTFHSTEFLNTCHRVTPPLDFCLTLMEFWCVEEHPYLQPNSASGISWTEMENTKSLLSSWQMPGTVSGKQKLNNCLTCLKSRFVCLRLY